MSDTDVEIHYKPHDIVRVETEAGNKQLVTMCMLDRLEDDEIIDGRVPQDMPEFDRPHGAKCHPNWRDGCDGHGISISTD